MLIYEISRVLVYDDLYSFLCCPLVSMLKISNSVQGGYAIKALEVKPSTRDVHTVDIFIRIAPELVSTPWRYQIRYCHPAFCLKKVACFGSPDADLDFADCQLDVYILVRSFFDYCYLTFSRFLKCVSILNEIVDDPFRKVDYYIRNEMDVFFAYAVIFPDGHRGFCDVQPHSGSSAES